MVEDWIANAYEGMSRRQFLSGAGAAGISLIGFAAAAKPVAGEIIETSTRDLATTEGRVPSDGFQVPYYEARPKASGTYPIVLVIPEIFGMHEHIKDVARRFAKAGFLAITFEPYARVMKDLDAILSYAKKHPSAKADRIGVTGFCRGGLYTLLFSAHNPEIKAAVSWYGQIRPAMTPGVRTEGPLDVVGRIKAPVLGLYGEADLGIPVRDVNEMEAALKAAGKTAEFVLYPGAPHAFFADYRPSYRAEAAKEAWGRCLSWFNKYLRDGTG